MRLLKGSKVTVCCRWEFGVVKLWRKGGCRVIGRLCEIEVCGEDVCNVIM